jgi:hypothetical protein
MEGFRRGFCEVDREEVGVLLSWDFEWAVGVSAICLYGPLVVESSRERERSNQGIVYEFRNPDAGPHESSVSWFQD